MSLLLVLTLLYAFNSRSSNRDRLVPGVGNKPLGLLVVYLGETLEGEMRAVISSSVGDNLLDMAKDLTTASPFSAVVEMSEVVGLPKSNLFLLL